MIIQPLGFTQDSFMRKTKTERNGAAFFIAQCTANINPVKLEYIKSIRGQSSAGSGHDALALLVAGDPVADHSAAVYPIDRVKANHTHKLTTIPDAGVETSAALVVGSVVEDELHRVFHAQVHVEPREPGAQVRPVFIDKSKQRLRVRFVEESKLNFVVDGQS